MLRGEKRVPLPNLKKFAREFIAARPKGAVVGLKGELGAGKTTFVRTCIEVIAEEQAREQPRVVSPSYVIHVAYEDISPRVDHLDLYRLDQATPEQILELGYQEILTASRRVSGFVFVEWPERAADPSSLELDFEVEITIDGEARRFTVK